MSIAPGLEWSYNTACEWCGLAGWEHRDDCPNAEPDRCRRCGEYLTDDAGCGQRAHDELTRPA